MDTVQKLKNSGIGVATDRDRFLSTLDFDPTYGEYLRAKVRQGFDFTTTRMIMEDVGRYIQEVEAYGQETEYQGQYARSLLAFAGKAGRELEAQNYEHFNAYKNPVRWTAEQYKESEYYREGIKWQDGWTEVRARVMAEQYDLRRYREAVIENADVSWLGAAVGFGATLVGSLPDPINLIPFGQGAAGARVGGKALLTGVRGKLAAGAAEGALGNMAANAFVYPDLIARGEELGFMDFIADTAAGAVLGVGLAGAGHAFGKGLNALAARNADDFNKVIKAAGKDMGVEMPEFHAMAMTRLKDLNIDTTPRTILNGAEMDTHLGGAEWHKLNELQGEEYSRVIKSLGNDTRLYFSKNMQGQEWSSPLGEVSITGKGKKEAFHNLNNLEKIMLLPALRDTIENPIYILRQPPKHERKDQINQFFRYYGVAELKGEKRLVSAVIGRDDNGKLFYELNPKDKDFFTDTPLTQAGPEEFARGQGLMAYVPLTQAEPGATARGQGLMAQRNVPEKNITQNGDNVNFIVHSADDVNAIAADSVGQEKLHVRQTLHGKDKAVVYKSIDKAVADMADGQPVDVKAIYEQSPAYQKMSRGEQMSLFPAENKPVVPEPPNFKDADGFAEAYGLEALEDAERLKTEGRLTDDELADLNARDAEIAKANAVKKAGDDFIKCNFGL